MYAVKVQSHRGITVVSESPVKSEAVKVMHSQSRTAVVVNASGRIVATNVARSF